MLIMSATGTSDRILASARVSMLATGAAGAT